MPLLPLRDGAAYLNTISGVDQRETNRMKINLAKLAALSANSKLRDPTAESAWMKTKTPGRSVGSFDDAAAEVKRGQDVFSQDLLQRRGRCTHHLERARVPAGILADSFCSRRPECVPSVAESIGARKKTRIQI